MSKTVLVIAAHPDDEILGCGGAMASHSAACDEVHTVIVAEGITSRDNARDREKRIDDLSILGTAARAAGSILGVASVDLLDMPDNRMDSVDLLDIIKVVEAQITKFQPDVIYTHHHGDLNIDHRRLHQAVLTAARPLPGRHRIESILAFEVASSTEWQSPGTMAPFTPNWYLDISTVMHKKTLALEAYGDEIPGWPHARSIKAVQALAAWRGANIGCEAAEAFMLARCIL